MHWKTPDFPYLLPVWDPCAAVRNLCRNVRFGLQSGQIWPKSINLRLFKISFSICMIIHNFLKRILKRPILFPFGANLGQLEAKSAIASLAFQLLSYIYSLHQLWWCFKMAASNFFFLPRCYVLMTSLVVVVSQASVPGPVVTTAFGPVHGLSRQVSQDLVVDGFRGIPYAKPPVGESVYTPSRQ